MNARLGILVVLVLVNTGFAVAGSVVCAAVAVVGGATIVYAAVAP